MSQQDYNASAIKALDQHTHLLKRLSLTFGPPEPPGVLFSSQKGVAVREILDNSLDEVRGGYGTHVKLSFFADRSVEVRDSGRGIPVDVGQDQNGKPASGIYLALGLIQSGGKFETDSKRFSSGLNGVGASSTVHCSRRADITVFRNGKRYELSFQDGTPGFFAEPNDPDSKFTPLKDLREVHESKDNRPAAEKRDYKTGTTIRFWLRDDVFSSPNPYDDQDIIQRLRGTSFLVPQLHAEVYNELKLIEDPETGQASPQHEDYHFPNGIEELVELLQPDNKLHETLHIVTEGKYLEKNVAVLRGGNVVNEDVQRTVPVEICFRWGDKYESTVESYVNTIHTKLHGAHTTAFERALVLAFNERFESMRGLIKKGEEPPIAEDFLEGITAVVSVQVSEPQFTSQSKEALSGREVQKAIQEALVEEFKKWIADRKNAPLLELISKKVTTAALNRQRAKEQKELNRQKNQISSSSLPTKLIDCDFAGTEEAELYICEGDSAVSSMKAARDGSRHALLGIRGKIINGYKENPKKVLANAEVQDIIKTLGAGAGSDFDLDKMRYGRIFITADADPDGNAIACLLYGLFWTLFKPVVAANRLYKVETPLFVFTVKGRGGHKIYAKDDREKVKISAQLAKQGKLPDKDYSISRLKGLGEMQADVLEETGLDPLTRRVTQITLDDLAAAEQSLELLFGTDTNLRKRWIEEAEVDESLLGE